MSQIDDKLFLKIFKDNRRGYFKSFMKLMSRLGDGYVWAFLYFSLYMFRIKYAILYFARAAAAVFISIFVFLFISLHNLTLACSPPLNTQTVLSMCLFVKPHLAKALLTSY